MQTRSRVRLPGLGRPGRLAGRLVLCLIAIGCVQVTAAGLGVTSSYADAPAQQGWWTVTNPGGVPSGLPVAVPPSPPDVPPDGLLVQGGASPTSPNAFAAVVYPVPDGATVENLTLAVAPNSGTTPNSTLELCELSGQSISSDQGGPISDAPSYDCSRKATASANGSNYQFGVSSLVSNGVLAVAILPSSVTDRVVLSHPGPDSLPLQQGTGSLQGSGSDQSAGTAVGNASQDTGAATGAIPAGVPINPVASSPLDTASASAPTLSGLGGADSGSAGKTPATGAATATQPVGQGIVSVAPASATITKASAEPLATTLAVIAVLAALGMWVAAGRGVEKRSGHPPGDAATGA